MGEIIEVKENSLILNNDAKAQGFAKGATTKEIPCDVLIAGTGYKQVRHWLPADVQVVEEKDGYWLYRNMVPPHSPRVIFLNSEVTTFTNITTPCIQARWVVELLKGRHKLPSCAEMEAAVDKIKEW